MRASLNIPQINNNGCQSGAHRYLRLKDVKSQFVLRRETANCCVRVSRLVNPWMRPEGYLNASLAVTSCVALKSAQTCVPVCEVYAAGVRNTSAGLRLPAYRVDRNDLLF
jgi:hypothetical protein